MVSFLRPASASRATNHAPKLRGLGIELDRTGLEALCQGANSAQEVASQLTVRHLTEAQTRTPESDWVWLAVLALWQRWWPAKPCLETLDDKIQDGYETLAQDGGAATDRWLDAWSDVLGLCDAAGITAAVRPACWRDVPDPAMTRRQPARAGIKQHDASGRRPDRICWGA